MIAQMAPNLTERLAAFAVAPMGTRLDAPARQRTRQTILNAMALATAAARAPAVEIAYEVVASLGTSPHATILGRGERIGVVWAALLNGMAAHVEDFDDTHLPTVLHPGAPIVPAALALAEQRGRGGPALLEAVAVGVEIAIRVGNGLCPDHFDRGWHVTGTMGQLGAVAAAGRIAGLSVEQMRDALGIATPQSAGVTAANGTMTKSWHPGKAAANGVEAVLLAELGVHASPQSIEGRRGLANLMAAAPDFETMLDGLGTRWELMGNAFKPYPCGIVSHAVIDAAIALRDRLGDPSLLEEVLIEVHPVVLDVMGIPEPRNGLQTKFSVYHCAAIGLVMGVAGPQQFSDAAAHDERIAEVRRRVRVETTTSVPKGAAVLAIKMKDGRRATLRIDHATGSEEHPMTDEQLATKARLIAGPVIGEDSVNALIDRVNRLESVGSASELVELTRPSQR